MKIVSNYFNFVTIVLKNIYSIKYSRLFHLCLSHKSGATILVQGDIGQNFIYEFLSSPVMQWRRKNFSSGGTFSKNVLIKKILKNKLKTKFIIKFVQNVKKNSSKIKFIELKQI